MSGQREPTAEARRRVAAVVAALVASEDPGVGVVVRVRTIWPEPGPWTWVGRRDAMRGGGRW